ncbi:hypothetical protein [Nitrosomonas sp.]|uniref:hypothetical protein n=1 Tax=Nitrosomonas sp. TaxID=42353 RepID=UPI0032EF02DD
MSHHTDYFKQAELALAAYANLVKEIPNQNELKEAEFSASQASTFADTYRVVT